MRKRRYGHGDDNVRHHLLTTTSTVALEPARINDMQLIGSHSSYRLRPEPEVYAATDLVSRDLAQSIDYSHRPLVEQLEEFGDRQFEIDVVADPDGGRYASRAALPVVGLSVESGLPELDEPGFKVLHTQDFDFGTSRLTMQLCPGEVAVWSGASPEHVPLMVMIEVKEESVPAAAADADRELPDLGIEWTEPVPTDAAVLDALDAELIEAMGIGRIIRPDDVRGDRRESGHGGVRDGQHRTRPRPRPKAERCSRGASDDHDEHAGRS